MNFRKSGLVIAGLLLVALLLLNRKDLQLLSQTDFAATKITSSGYELKSILHLKNPNLLSSTVNSINEKFYLNDLYIGEFNNEIQQGIPGLKETSFPLNIRFTTGDISSIFSNDSTLLNIPCRISVSGEITFSNLSGGGKITVNQTDSIIIIP